MAEELESFFQRLADSFLGGDEVWLAAAYTYPLSIFAGSTIRIEHSSAALLTTLAKRRRDAITFGASIIRSQIVDIKVVKSLNLDVHVHWNFVAETGRAIAQDRIRFLCRRTESNDFIIESVEFLVNGIAMLKKFHNDADNQSVRLKT
ncbi:MAG: hypothetical protein GKR98_08480 [Boseongicola sp.]|nr:MAG: hypothetical protein GKR98_08480 [Boseongicola sp.]